MNPIRLIKAAIAAIRDPERDFKERVFLILAFATEVAMLIGLEGDLIMKEDPVEMLVVGVILVVLPVAAFAGLRFNKLGIVIKFIVLAVSFTVFPILFFFGGGLQGGGVLWMIFAFMYVGVLLSGKWRSVMSG